MSWQAYFIVFRLCSPMHIGEAKMGNVQRTRRYVTGRALWGALTQRLTRDGQRGKGPATDPRLYRDMGTLVHEQLAFTYLYPTTDHKGTVDLWPWDNGFPARFLSTYGSTALTYPRQSAEEGTLHEVEFVSPRALDLGRQVYLAGYMFAQETAPDWRSALDRLQLGGERGYGWGNVELALGPEPWDGKSLFGEEYALEPGDWPPVLVAAKDSPRLLAHALAVEFEGRKPIGEAKGKIEPLMGRETPGDGRSGTQVAEARICHEPGAMLKGGQRVRIGPYGIWEAA